MKPLLITRISSACACFVLVLSIASFAPTTSNAASIEYEFDIRFESDLCTDRFNGDFCDDYRGYFSDLGNGNKSRGKITFELEDSSIVDQSIELARASFTCSDMFGRDCEVNEGGADIYRFWPKSDGSQRLSFGQFPPGWEFNFDNDGGGSAEWFNFPSSNIYQAYFSLSNVSVRNSDLEVVPVPASLPLLLIGVASLGLWQRGRKRR